MSLEFTRNVLSIHDLLFSLESIRNHKQDKKKEKKKNKKETVTVVVCVFQNVHSHVSSPIISEPWHFFLWKGGF